MLTKDSFDKLLQWLDSNREEAATKYERIRLRLIKYFVCNRCDDADEDLADKTFDRVAMKLERGEVPEPFTGDKALYFLAFARYIRLEHLENKKRLDPFDDTGSEPPAPEPGRAEDRAACLEMCKRMLADEDRGLAYEYYNCEKSTKVGYHKQLADEASLSLPGLRTRMHRIRDRLKPCIEDCLDRLSR